MENNTLETANAPAVFNTKSVKQWLLDNGGSGVMSATTVANILGVSRKTVKNAENSGKIKAIDKCTYSIDSITEWLIRNPRYVAQQKKFYKVTEETYMLIRKILLKQYPRLIELFYGDVDDCVHEVAYRLSKTTLGAPCSDQLIIIRAINNLWHSKQIQTANQTVSLDSLRGGQSV